jgi:hypothetical protein
MNYQLAAIALNTSFLEPMSFSPEVPGCSQVSLLKLSIPVGSEI